jgi:hypothetical protein
MDRSVVTGLNVFIDGYGNLGIAESFKSPAIKQKKLTQNTPAGERSVAYGALESLDTEVKFKSLPKAIFSEIAKLDNAKIILKKAIKTGSTTEALVYTCTGAIDLEYGEAKEGEYLDVTVIQKGLKKYIHEHGSKVVVKIDHENIIAEVNGTDLLAETRKIIGA